ncbi:MAG: hypothetical protein HC845_04780 [Akkermansiaceae bacterium]|nr:hypothetical protein [Akkermansiaceae bacterium]
MNKTLFISAAIFATSIAISTLQAAEKIKVLIVDGPQEVHEYEKTTPLMKEILEKLINLKSDFHDHPQRPVRMEVMLRNLANMMWS